jgi:hypothetical protein
MSNPIMDEELPESIFADVDSEYAQKVAFLFSRTGTVGATLLLYEIANRLPLGNQTRSVINKVLADTNVVVRRTAEHMQSLIDKEEKEDAAKPQILVPSKELIKCDT